LVSVYDLKPRFQALLRPLVNRLAARGVTANQVTMAAFVLCLAHGAWIGAGGGAWALLALPVTLFLRMALNAIDGMLAREHGQASRLGLLLNELTDVAGDAALYLPLAGLAALPGGLAIGVVTIGLIAEMAGAIAPRIGAERRYDGPFGKSDRAAYFGLLAVLVALGPPAPGFVLVYVAAGGALALICLANRIRRAVRAGG
jgi:CDP-diacylglycerol--glycerol-3-phosphate 3-phosphatidyltransferase